MDFYQKHRLFFRAISLVLITALITVTYPAQLVWADLAQSANYKLNGTINQGGDDRASAAKKIWQDALGQSVSGKSQSPSYILISGFISTIQSNPPLLTQNIPNFSWRENEDLNNAFDLDDYFTSPDGLTLTYTVAGNSQITVDINPTTHQVSFSQPQAWFGLERVTFTATDTDHNTKESNEVALQVEGVDNPPVLAFIDDITVNENALVEITPQATDLDGDTITYTFTTPLDAQGKWQTDYNDAGDYTVTVTATDTTSLSDSQEVKIKVLNVNRAPVLDPIAAITANEGELVTITPTATDPDGDAVTFYYTAPFDTNGTWQTDYDDAGTQTITVTASDQVDTVNTTASVTINNTNRAPVVTLTLNEYTVEPNQNISVTLEASDPDSNAMTFVLEKDGATLASGPITNTYTTVTSFSAIGDHTISATVTDNDSSPLSTTDSKGIDVVNPNDNRDSINPIMGDFNGDALSDLGLHNSDTGNWEICLSDEGEFRNATDWLSGFGTSKDWIPLGGDFNGDGKTDVGLYNNRNGELQVATSNGSAFATQGTWLTFGDASFDWQPFTGNFNADKYTDFGVYNRDNGEVRIALGNGSGFNDFSTWLNSFGGSKDWIFLPGDFNGDSLTDAGIFKKSAGEFKVAFSKTNGFVPSGGAWISGYATDKDILLSDFNKDGLTDLGYWDKDNTDWFYAASTGRALVDKGLWLDNFGSSVDETAHTGDYNGDGVTDAACFDRDAIGINRWRVHLSTRQPVDLLVEIDNGIGGKTQITYEYASTFENDLLPFPVYVAKTISLIDTLPADQPQETYTQAFIYSGGWFDPEEREFRGFRKITVTDPITNNYTETYFFQGKPAEGGALKGKIEKVLSYDGNNQLISQAHNSWEVETAGGADSYLGFPYLKEITATAYENNIPLTTKTTLTYDNIGNVTQTLNQGDMDVTGDEKVSKIVYAAAYEAGYNLPLETTFEDTAGEIYSKKTLEYDDRGNVTAENQWLFESPLTIHYSLLTIHYSYDSFGNVLTATNPKNSTVTTDYETQMYTFPERTANSLGHTVTYTYDTKLGALTSVTDTNSNTTTTTYDSLGRTVQGKNAYNQVVVDYTYPDFNTKVTTQAGLISTQHIDGLGRNYKNVTSGEDGGSARNVISEVFFNNRGLKDHESLPYYEGEAAANIAYIRYEYDLRGRITKTISDFPGTLKDAQAQVNYLEPLYTETINPKGNKKGIRKDVYGNNLTITEFTQGGVYHTNYEYDIQGNLLKTIDSQGNTIQIWYDSLGHKTRMNDPDMGVWSYEYDDVGNLVSQTDAKGQIIEFEYDIINRLIKKQGLSPQGTVPVVYTYDDTNKDNCIGRLSKVEDSSGQTEFFYDKLGREIKSTKTVDGTPYTVERTYDILDRLTTLTYPDGQVVNYTYDTNSGNLEKVSSTNNQQPTTNYVEDITYDAQGKIKNIHYGNNTQTDYTYSQDLRLSHIQTTNNQLQTTFQDLHYDFDKNGNLTTLTDNLRSNIRSYSYDDLDRLTEAQNIPDQSGGYTTFTYQYDPIGNMTYKSDLGVMEYGQGAGPHAVTTAGAYTYRYDANGNMIEGKDKLLAYDTENRLIEVHQSGTTTTTFLYDGDGGRVKKAVSDQQSAISETIYIGSLYELRAEGGELKAVKHIYAGSNKTCTVEPDHTYYVHSDHLDSSNVMTDETGTKVSQTEYQPYGKVSQQTGDDVTPYKFTGKELDTTGLYYYGARYYDPEIGRFISPDSIVQSPFDPQTLNRYTYVRNNPIKYVDPSGHVWFIPFIIAIVKAAVIGAAIGAGLAAITGGDIGKGALLGALSGAVFAGVSSLAQTAMKFAITGTTQVSLIGGARATANIVSSVVAGGAAGAASAGISGADVGEGAWKGAAIAGGLSLTREISVWMRRRMVAQSRLDPRNSSGKSVGFDGDKFKLGGGRYDPVHPNGNPSPLGGAQGGPGQIFGIYYKPGSIWDRIIETYAGPHDFLNSWGYDLFGNLKNQNTFESFLGATMNPLNVVLATPIAVASIIPRAAYSAPSVIYGQSTNNDTDEDDR